MPFFSIIIPVYNVASYLRECLDSVLAQTFTDWEAICVDDGSTDGSSAILDEYAARDPRFRVIHQPNAGVSAARNRGMEIMRGMYVWFVDSDDKIRRGSFAGLYRIAEECCYPEAINIVYSVNELHSLVSFDVFEAKRKCSIVRDSQSFFSYRGSLFRHVFLSESIFGLRFVKGMKMGEDSLFSVLAYYNINNYVDIDEPLYYYRQRPGSASHKLVSLEMVRDWMSLQIRILRILRDHKEIYNDKMALFHKWNSSYVFYTSGLAFFKLNSNDMRICFDSWLRLVRMAGEISCHRLWKRVIIWLLSRLRYPFLARLLVLRPYQIRSLLGGV